MSRWSHIKELCAEKDGTTVCGVLCWPKRGSDTVVRIEAELATQLSEGHASRNMHRRTAAGI